MKVAGAQPKRTSAATANTKPSDTPLASVPSTGTGRRSANVDAARNATTPATVAGRPGCNTNSIVAARYAAIPAIETGATTASSLAGGSTRADTSDGLCYQVKLKACTAPSATESTATARSKRSFFEPSIRNTSDC